MDYFVRLFSQFFVSLFPALHVALILLVLFTIAGCSDGSDSPGASNARPERPLIADLAFADPALGDCVAEAAADSGWRYVDEVTALACPDRQIASLEGMHAFSGDSSNLVTLDLDLNEIEDLAPLGSLALLQTLHLGGCCGRNEVEDIGPLANLARLRVLSLNSSSFGDLTPLAGLTDLEELAIEGTENDVGKYGRVTDISPLGGLENLVSLKVWRQSPGIGDISPLTTLNRLEVLYLDVSPDVRDLSPLATLGKLTELTVVGPVEDLAPLASLTNLETLVVSSRLLQDTTGVGNLSQLLSLEFRNCYQLAKLEPIAPLAGLQTLRIRNTAVEDLAPLASLGGLRELQIEWFELESTPPDYRHDLAPLANLDELSLLSINQNNVEDLAPLGGLDALRGLFLTANGIDDVTVLASLTGLRELAVNDNPVPCSQLADLEAALPDTRVGYRGCTQ